MSLIRRKARKREMLEFSLNVNSLMDVLTVLLFFLMKSFSVSSTNLEVAAGIKLPESAFKGAFEESVSVSLSAEELKTPGKLLTKLEGGRFPAQAFTGDQHTITALKAFLGEELKKRNALITAAAPQGTEIDFKKLPAGKILIQSDQALPFATVKYVLRTAAEAGYGDYSFIVQNPEE